MYGMIPKLHEQMNRCQNGKYFIRNTQQRSRYQKQGKKPKQYRNGLTEGTRQIEFFAAVVNNVSIPKNIHFVVEAMIPITSKILGNKCQNKQKWVR